VGNLHEHCRRRGTLKPATPSLHRKSLTAISIRARINERCVDVLLEKLGPLAQRTAASTQFDEELYVCWSEVQELIELLLLEFRRKRIDVLNSASRG
jgi:hypothetical protein